MDSQDSLPLTVPVRTFACIALGLGENAAYASAARGDFPTVRLGKLVRVPLRAALLQLAGGDQAILEKLAADFLQKLQKIEPRMDRRGRLRGTKIIDGKVVAAA
jgi:hypothetical protein